MMKLVLLGVIYMASLASATHDVEDVVNMLLAENDDLYESMKEDVKKNKIEIHLLEKLIDERERENSILEQHLAKMESDVKSAKSPLPGKYSFGGFACEREFLAIQCPEDRLIELTSAYYGQYSDQIPCEENTCCVPHPVRDCVELVAENSVQDWAAMQLACNEKNSCFFDVPSASVFTCTDPYYLDYMTIYFSCLPEPEEETVAFTAYSGGVYTYELGKVVRFDAIETNLGGYYQPDASVFVCPYDGVYVFSVSITGSNSSLNVDIMRGEDGLITARSHTDHFDQGSTLVVTECVIEEKVWVRADSFSTLLGGQIDKYTSFSGFMLHRY